MDTINYEPADILIYITGKGLVLKEKSLVAFHTESKKIVAIGTDVEQIAEEALKDVQILSPLRQGTIADYLVAVKLFSFLLKKAWGKHPLRRPAVAICAPKGMVDVEKKALQDTLYQSGAKEVLIVDLPFHQFVRELSENPLKPYRNISTVLAITKNEPEKYIREQLAHTLRYAQQEGISSGRVATLLEELSGVMHATPASPAK